MVKLILEKNITKVLLLPYMHKWVNINNAKIEVSRVSVSVYLSLPIVEVKIMLLPLFLHYRLSIISLFLLLCTLLITQL